MSIIISASSPTSSSVSGALRLFTFHFLRQCSQRQVIHYFACQSRETAEKHVGCWSVLEMSFRIWAGFYYVSWWTHPEWLDQLLDQTAKQDLHLLMKVKWLLRSQLCWRNWYICLFYDGFHSVWMLNVGAKCLERSPWSYIFLAFNQNLMFTLLKTFLLSA